MITLGSTHHGEMITSTSTPWSWCAQWRRGHVHFRFSWRSTRLDLHFLNNFNEYGKANWKRSRRVRHRWKRASSRLIPLKERMCENMSEQSPTPRTRSRELLQVRKTPRRRRSGVKSEKCMFYVMEEHAWEDSERRANSFLTYAQGVRRYPCAMVQIFNEYKLG